MYSNLKQSVFSLFIVLLLVIAFVPVALAWGPPGSDGWYLGPNGGWYQGAPWGPPHYYQHSPEFKYYWPDGNFQPSYPPNYHYEGYYAPAPSWPAPQPPFYVQPAPSCSYPLSEPYTWSGSIPFPSGTCYSNPPIIADRYHIPWGTFGTYDNWAHAFYREHGRCPNEQDVRDFWYSQAYAATHCGRSPW